ncbi:MAG: hypothetical protein MUO77_13015 [Anaerolineales bacterium]|nr:hypothetical protein [Anaerolineales bacterium]
MQDFRGNMSGLTKSLARLTINFDGVTSLESTIDAALGEKFRSFFSDYQGQIANTFLLVSRIMDTEPT